MNSKLYPLLPLPGADIGDTNFANFLVLIRGRVEIRIGKINFEITDKHCFIQRPVRPYPRMLVPVPVF